MAPVPDDRKAEIHGNDHHQLSSYSFQPPTRSNNNNNRSLNNNQLTTQRRVLPVSSVVLPSRVFASKGNNNNNDWSSSPDNASNKLTGQEGLAHSAATGATIIGGPISRMRWNNLSGNTGITEKYFLSSGDIQGQTTPSFARKDIIKIQSRRRQQQQPTTTTSARSFYELKEKTSLDTLDSSTSSVCRPAALLGDDSDYGCYLGDHHEQQNQLSLAPYRRRLHCFCCCNTIMSNMDSVFHPLWVEDLICSRCAETAPRCLVCERPSQGKSCP